MGKIGCAQCIIGAIIIVLHAPNQHIATDIEEFKRMFFAPGIYKRNKFFLVTFWNHIFFTDYIFFPKKNSLLDVCNCFNIGIIINNLENST
jgi:hypothetical protein